MDTQLHGVTQRGKFHQCQRGAGNNTHIKKMLAQCAFPTYFGNARTLTGLQVRNGHETNHLPSV